MVIIITDIVPREVPTHNMDRWQEPLQCASLLVLRTQRFAVVPDTVPMIIQRQLINQEQCDLHQVLVQSGQLTSLPPLMEL